MKTHKQAKEHAQAKKPEPGERLQTSGTFKKTDAALVFTDDQDTQAYYVINSLTAKVGPHLDQPVNVVAKVKPAKTGPAKLMVHIISIKPSK